MSDVKIDAKLVKELREKSGAPMGDCLKALQETNGDIENAFVVLRKRGMASAAKEGLAHDQRRRGRNLHPRRRRRQDRRPARAPTAKATSSPAPTTSRSCSKTSPCTSCRVAGTRATLARTKSPKPTSTARRTSTVPRASLPASPKPSSRRCSIGKLSKFYEEFCLLEQPFIKDQAVSIGQLSSRRRSPSSAETSRSAASPASKIGDPNYNPSPRRRPRHRPKKPLHKPRCLRTA